MRGTRLCIDGRAAADFSAAGINAQETLEWILGKEPDEEGIRESFGERSPLLVTHPRQRVPGEWPRLETSLRLRRTPLHWAWERRLLHEKAVTACHRFRPADRLTPYPNCATLTTLLPPVHGLPFSISRRATQSYVVPSHGDQRLLVERYDIDPERVHQLLPRIRRWIPEEKPRTSAEGVALFLVGRGADLPARKKLVRILGSAFPDLARRVVSLDRGDFRRESWLKHLQGVRVCFYLSATAFDWPVLALESLFWGIPTVFPDANRSLTELLPSSVLKLSRFLVDPPDLAVLTSVTRFARERLGDLGAWEPQLQAREYRSLYGSSFGAGGARVEV